MSGVPGAPLRDPARYKTMGTSRCGGWTFRASSPAAPPTSRTCACRNAARPHAEGTELRHALQSPDIAASRTLPGVVRSSARKLPRGRRGAGMDRRSRRFGMRRPPVCPRRRRRCPRGDVVRDAEGAACPRHRRSGPPERAAPAALTGQAPYSRPWLNSRIDRPILRGGTLQDGVMTVWTHSQGTFPLRRVVAELVGMPAEKVHCHPCRGVRLLRPERRR